MSRVTDLDVDDLVDRAKQGRVSDRELTEVAAALRACEAGSEAYSLLYVLGRSEATGYEELVAGFLRSGDPELARLALQVLCTFWGLTESYVDEVRRFLGDVDWDADGWVRQIAISVAGAHLRAHTDTGMLARLLELAATGNGAVERRIALEALSTALGDPVAETLTAGGDDRAAWTARVRARAEDRLAAEQR